MSGATPHARPLPFEGGGRVKRPPRRFSTCQSLSGTEVIDFDGRTVAVRDEQHEAEGIAARLNDAAHAGSRELSRQLARLI